jgi:3-(3-hydroxy-phenyl)propionate hydroxylase
VIDITTLDDQGAIAAWLADRKADAVLIRPDHYVFGTGKASDLVACRAALIAGVTHQEIAA